MTQRTCARQPRACAWAVLVIVACLYTHTAEAFEPRVEVSADDGATAVFRGRIALSDAVHTNYTGTHTLRLRVAALPTTANASLIALCQECALCPPSDMLTGFPDTRVHIAACTASMCADLVYTRAACSACCSAHPLCGSDGCIVPGAGIGMRLDANGFEFAAANASSSSAVFGPRALSKASLARGRTWIGNDSCVSPPPSAGPLWMRSIVSRHSDYMPTICDTDAFAAAAVQSGVLLAADADTGTLTPYVYEDDTATPLITLLMAVWFAAGRSLTDRRRTPPRRLFTYATLVAALSVAIALMVTYNPRSVALTAWRMAGFVAAIACAVAAVRAAIWTDNPEALRVAVALMGDACVCLTTSVAGAAAGGFRAAELSMVFVVYASYTAARVQNSARVVAVSALRAATAALLLVFGTYAWDTLALARGTPIVCTVLAVVINLWCIATIADAVAEAKTGPKRPRSEMYMQM